MSHIRKYFQSRFPGGLLIEVDFSQLEVIVLAHLTGDKQLIEDIVNGTDVHAINAEKLFGKGFTPKHRKIAKRLSFQLQYGAGYKSMAKAQGITEVQAKAFISAYYERYPEVKVWQDTMIDMVKKSRVPTGEKSKNGIPIGFGTLRTQTGRVYGFFEEDDPYHPGEVSFKPTNIKNYPVQGMATADIVPLMLGKLFREIRAASGFYKTILMVNTVHDSVVFDVAKGSVRKTLEIITNVLSKTRETVSEHFGFDFTMDLPFGVSVGVDWASMAEIDVDSHHLSVV